MIQILIQGLLLSGLYALLAMGFTLIFSIGRVLNLAYGSYLLIGGYVYFQFSQVMGLPKLAGVALAALMGVVMGIAKFRLIVKPLKGAHVPVEISLLILAVVLQAAVVLVFGDSSKILLPIIPGVKWLAGTAIPYSNLFAAVASWLILIGLYVFVRTTHTGRAMQAVSMDPKGAAISGIDSVGQTEAATRRSRGLKARTHTAPQAPGTTRHKATDNQERHTQGRAERPLTSQAPASPSIGPSCASGTRAHTPAVESSPATTVDSNGPRGSSTTQRDPGPAARHRS